MALLLPVASQVGLQLLLSPGTSGMIFNGACTTLGVAYPAYASYKTIRSKDPHPEVNQQMSQWLTYWAVWSTLTAAESLLPRSRIPGYYHLKLIFLLWLQSSHYQGARRLYVELAQPFLAKHERQIDYLVDGVRSLVSRLEFKLFGNYFQQLLASVPYLEWFVRPPPPDDTAPLAPPTPPKSRW